MFEKIEVNGSKQAVERREVRYADAGARQRDRGESA
jgi:hypothetical protein